MAEHYTEVVTIRMTKHHKQKIWEYAARMDILPAEFIRTALMLGVTELIERVHLEGEIWGSERKQT